MQQLFKTWQLGEAKTKNPTQLLRTAWFYITFYFGKRGHENQRKFLKQMLVLRETPGNRKYYELQRTTKEVLTTVQTSQTVKCSKLLILFVAQSKH